MPGIRRFDHVGITVAKVTTSLRLKLIGRLLEAKWIYFTREPVGRFGNAISGEATRAGEAYLSVAVLIAVQLQTLMYLFLAYLIAWQIALAAIVFGAALTLLLSWMPVIGDPLTLAAGVMREPLRVFLPLVALAKTTRYAVLAVIAVHYA